MTISEDAKAAGEVLIFFGVFTGMYGMECFVAYGRDWGKAVGWSLGRPFILCGVICALFGCLILLVSYARNGRAIIAARGKGE